MSRTATTIALLSVIFAPALAAGEDAPDAGALPERKLAGRLNEAVGTIETIDYQARTLTIRTDVNPVVLFFDRNTTVFLEKRTGTLRDLKKGTRVRSGYEVIDAKNRGRWIELTVEPSGSGNEQDGGAPPGASPAAAPADAGTPKP